MEQFKRKILKVEIALYSLEVESRTKLFQTWIQKDNSKVRPSSKYTPHLQGSGFKTSYNLEALSPNSMFHYIKIMSTFEMGLSTN